MKTHQLVALVDGRKSRMTAALTEFYKTFQKSDNPLLFGLTRTYQPFADTVDPSERLPAENKRVQTTVRLAIKPVLQIMAEALDTVKSQDDANCTARADIRVDGQVLLAKVPVTTLLYLEKRVVDLRTVIEKLPVLDMSESWDYDSTSDLYRSRPATTFRSNKVKKVLVLVPASKEHPAQAESITEDVNVGTWTATKFSGAIPADKKAAMLDNVTKLLDAVKLAREEANSGDASMADGWCKPMLDFVFKPLEVTS